MTFSTVCLSPANPSEAKSPPLRISVVVPVRNRTEELRDLLRALGRQSFPREQFEVLLCDDGSTEDLATVAATAAHESGLQILHLWQPWAGQSRARNLGIAHAQGKILVFTDSDCVPTSEWLSALVSVFDDPLIGLAGGQIGFQQAEHFSGRCVNFVMGSTLGAAGARDPRGSIHMRYYPRAGNLAVRCDLARKANGFPEVSHGEDLEFSHRILRFGVKVQFVPEAVVLHNERRSVWAVFQQAFRKGQARIRLSKECGMHECLHALPALLTLYLFATAVCLPFWPADGILLLVPGMLYCLLLVFLGAQGAVKLREGGAAAGIPVYAAVMHVGYGLGYLYALTGARRHRSAACEVDWTELRRVAVRYASPSSSSPGSVSTLHPGLY